MTTVPSMLAAFVSPALLYAGAAAVSIPIIIHLLTRKRFRRIRWAAMEFLFDAQRRNRRRLRMEEWLLLLLRCLAVLGIGLFIARPYLTPKGAVAGFGGARRVERLFVLDDSYSMGYQLDESGQTPFTKAKTAIRRLVQAIQLESPEDTVTLIRTSKVADPVALQTFLDEKQTEELFLRLEGLAPSQKSLDSSSVIQGVVELLQRSPEVAGVVTYVVSDFQRVDWLPSERTAELDTGAAAGKDGAKSPAGVFDPLVRWSSDDRGLRVVLVNVADADAANAAVAELTPASNQIVAGSTARIRARVTNHAARASESLGLELSLGGQPQPTQTIREIGPRQSATLEMDAEFVRPGFEPVRLILPADRLPLDDTRYLAVNVTSSIRVLIVNGEPAGEAYDDETTFLTTALRPEGELFSGNEPVVIDEAELDGTNLTGFHLVILANVYRVSDPVAAALDRYVRDGGGLAIFLGDQIDPELYNSVFYRDGQGILPARITEPVRAPQAAHLVLVDRAHPALRGLGGEGDPLGLGQVPFFQYFACEPLVPPGRSAEAESPDAPQAAPPSQPAAELAASVVMRFDDAAERPAVIERRVGLGRSMLVTTSADKEWHLWPDHPTFLPIMIEFINHLARRGAAAEETFVGARIELPLDPSLYESDCLLRGPNYPEEPEVSITAAAAEGDRGLVVAWDHTDVAGFYEFILRKRDGGEATRMVAVNTDPREGDLATSTEQDLRRAFPGLPFEYVQNIEVLAGGTGEARTELWRPFLWATALVLLTEQFLAWFWGRRR